MHTLDAPMIARAAGDVLDVERDGSDVVASLEAAVIGVLGARQHLDEGLHAGEARLARIGPLGAIQSMLLEAV